jgi:hypothetical protein
MCYIIINLKRLLSKNEVISGNSFFKSALSSFPKLTHFLNRNCVNVFNSRAEFLGTFGFIIN